MVLHRMQCSMRQCATGPHPPPHKAPPPTHTHTHWDSPDSVTSHYFRGMLIIHLGHTASLHFPPPQQSQSVCMTASVAEQSWEKHAYSTTHSELACLCSCWSGYRPKVGRKCWHILLDSTLESCICFECLSWCIFCVTELKCNKHSHKYNELTWKCGPEGKSYKWGGS